MTLLPHRNGSLSILASLGRLVALVVTSSLGCTGCTGVLGGTSDKDGTTGAGDGSDSEPGGEGTPSDTGAPLGPTLRLLTRPQYESSLGSLFSFADSLNLTKLEDDIALNGSRSIGAANVALSAKKTEAYLSIAEQAADLALSDPAFLGCDPNDSGCVDEFIQGFGSRAFRRPLAAEEISSYRAIYDQGTAELGGTVALKYVVQALLVSPHFLYRTELGEASGGERILSSIELASKLAYFLWDAPPDDELFDQAVAADLRDPGLLRAQAERLMNSPRFSDGLTGLFNDYLRLFELSTVEKLPGAFPQFGPELKNSMQQETLLNLQYASESGADFRRVFDAPVTFVDADLAAHYGFAGSFGSEFVQVELPPNSPRSGLLTNASLLSLYAHSTSSSPTLRGKFVRETVLCQHIPAPPPEVDTTLPDAMESNTTRERFSQHATDPGCATCHRLMDPIGLALENFDAVGQFREFENGFPIDPSGDLDGRGFDDPTGLSQALAEHEALPECVARTAFRYAWGRLENKADGDVIETISAQFSQSGYQLRELILAAVTDPGFYTLGPLD